MVYLGLQRVGIEGGMHFTWWVWGSQRVGEAGLVVLMTCRWDMSTDFVQWDEVLGLVALGFHQVMSTFGIEGVITGGL